MNTTEGKFLCFYHGRTARLRGPMPAFGLIELIVALAIIATTAGIMMPALRNARNRARAVRTMSNQRQIVIAVTSYASDNSGRYPQSVATIGSLQDYWNWQEPTMLTALDAPDLREYRSLSAYLSGYIDDARVMFCPNAPKQYKYLDQSWQAGDRWNNPETPHDRDPVVGSYCFYWNYVGFIEDSNEVFRGPQGPTGGKGQSKLLVSDYFGYGHWRNKLAYRTSKAYGSCEKFKSAGVTPGTSVSSDFWSYPESDGGESLETIEVDLHAGFIDGHIETYTPAETVPMQVSITPDGGTPYPSQMGPGIFYLPQLALD
ncbi:MAG: type II secretion system protein [Planctomycetota bacterium]|jgi:type II secretory pathway pseudopilin PulG